MNMTEETRGPVTVLRIGEPRLDAARAPALREVLLRHGLSAFRPGAR